MKNALLLLMLAAGSAAPVAWATGNHANGHGNGHDESGIGLPGKPADVTRTVIIGMSDAMRFSPARFDVKQGETVRLVVRNDGKLRHELVLGTAKALQDHYEVMKKHPEMQHADPNMMTLAPGKTGELIWRFSKAGEVDFACLQAGHFEAGMKGQVTVTAVKSPAARPADPVDKR